MANAVKVKDSLFGQKQTKLLMDLLVYVVLTIVGIIFIMPFAWMVANSVKDIPRNLQISAGVHSRSLAFRELHRSLDGHAF